MAELNFGASPSHTRELPAGSGLRDWQIKGNILGISMRSTWIYDANLLGIQWGYGIFVRTWLGHG